MKVIIDLDPRDVWAIQERAEREGVSPGDVVRAELESRRNAARVRDRVAELHGTGMCDADIAAALSYLPGTVATIRRGLGLPANRRYQRRTA